MTDLKGKTALVTGSTSGIGKATAIALAARGAHVLVVGRNEQRAKDVVAEIEGSGGSATSRLTTLSDLESARELVEWATEAGDGHVDILINNAGVALLGPSNAATEAEFDESFALNVKVPFFLPRNLLRRSSSSQVMMPASSTASLLRSTGAGSQRNTSRRA